MEVCDAAKEWGNKMSKSLKIKKGSAATNKHSTKPKKKQHLNGLDTNNTLLSLGFSNKIKIVFLCG